MKITMYSTPTCPKCSMIKDKLSSGGYEFEINQCIEEMQNLGIMSVPALKVDDGELVTDFAAIVKFVNDLPSK